MGKAILVIVGGCLLVIIGLVGRRFYSADIVGGSISDKPIPIWLGRTLFIVVGVLFIVAGIALMPIW